MTSHLPWASGCPGNRGRRRHSPRTPVLEALIPTALACQHPPVPHRTGAARAKAGRTRLTRQEMGWGGHKSRFSKLPCPALVALNSPIAVTTAVGPLGWACGIDGPGKLQFFRPGWMPGPTWPHPDGVGADTCLLVSPTSPLPAYPSLSHLPSHRDGVSELARCRLQGGLTLLAALPASLLLRRVVSRARCRSGARHSLTALPRPGSRCSLLRILMKSRGLVIGLDYHIILLPRALGGSK